MEFSVLIVMGNRRAGKAASNADVSLDQLLVQQQPAYFCRFYYRLGGSVFIGHAAPFLATNNCFAACLYTGETWRTQINVCDVSHKHNTVTASVKLGMPV